MTHQLVHDGNLKWRLNNSKQIGVYVALFTDIILLMQPQEDKLVLRCQNTQVVAGREDTKFEHSPIIRVRDLLVRDNASGERICVFLVLSHQKLRSLLCAIFRSYWFESLMEKLAVAYVCRALF